jgi:NCS1 family nucleobase:cation symporter-1
MSSVDVVNPGDRGYRDEAAKVEPYGIDHIPDVERHGEPSSQFSVWVAGNLSLAVLLLGFYPVFFGLSLPQSLIAVTVGTAAGAVLMGVLSAMGTKLGVPQQIQARGALGYVGNFLPVAFVNVFAAMGWAAVNTVFGTYALQAVIDMPFWLGALIISAVQIPLAVYGYNMIHLVNRVGTVVIGLLFAIITILALGHADWSFGANPDADLWVGQTGSFITAAGFFFAYLVAWAPFSSDYSRYLPAKTSNAKVALFTALGNFVPVFWLGAVGVLVASTAGSLEPVAAIEELTGDFATVALIGIVLSTWPGNGLNIYGGGLSILTLGIPVSRQAATLIIGAAAYALAIWAQSDVYGKFYDFLLLSAYLIAPYAAVIIVDYYMTHRRSEKGILELYDSSRVLSWGFLAWIIGVAASAPFWVWTRWTGPFAESNPNAGDLSYYVGGVVAAVAFYVILKVKRTEAPIGPSVAETLGREPVGVTAGDR